MLYNSLVNLSCILRSLGLARARQKHDLQSLSHATGVFIDPRCELQLFATYFPRLRVPPFSNPSLPDFLLFSLFLSLFLLS